MAGISEEAESFLIGVQIGEELGASLEAWVAAECIPRVYLLAEAGASPPLVGAAIAGLLRSAADVIEQHAQRP